MASTRPYTQPHEHICDNHTGKTSSHAQAYQTQLSPSSSTSLCIQRCNKSSHSCHFSSLCKHALSSLPALPPSALCAQYAFVLHRFSTLIPAYFSIFFIFAYLLHSNSCFLLMLWLLLLQHLLSIQQRTSEYFLLLCTDCILYDLHDFPAIAARTFACWPRCYTPGRIRNATQRTARHCCWLHKRCLLFSSWHIVGEFFHFHYTGKSNVLRRLQVFLFFTIHTCLFSGYSSH